MKTIKLGGREFVPLEEPTVQRDEWLLTQLERSGLQDLRVEPGESNAAFARRITVQLAREGRGRLLLGGLMVPKGTRPRDWTPRLARETAEYLGTLNGENDRVTLSGLAASMLLGFHASGMLSFTTSVPASEGEDPAMTSATVGTAGGSGGGAPSFST